MTLRRGQATGRVNKAQEESGNAVGIVVTRASFMEVEQLRQQARLSARGQARPIAARVHHT